MTLQGAHTKGGRNLLPEDLSLINDGAVVFDQEIVHWIGETKNLPREYQSLHSFNLKDHVLTPGLVDSHTHLVFGGNRAEEYLDRLNGVDYQMIAKRGGGILYTMKETLLLSEEELFESAQIKLERFISHGIKVLEIKSGYALTIEGELKLLRVIKKLKETNKARIKILATYLGAHAIPQEFSDSRSFLKDVVIPTLKQAHAQSLVDFVDIFVEVGYFSLADARELFAVAKSLHLKTRIHADEFTNLECGSLAVELGCSSADHLLQVSDSSINRLAQSETVATLLPGTAFFLGKALAPARKLLDAGCRVSLASDFNPGSSHIDNLLFVASMAAPNLKMNMAEVWAGITLNPAFSLGLNNHGYLAPGSSSSITLFRVSQISEITYSWGHNLRVQQP